MRPLRQFGTPPAPVDIYEDRGCGFTSDWPRAGNPGPSWEYLGTLALDTHAPGLVVTLLQQVQGSSPPPPGPTTGLPPHQSADPALWALHLAFR